MRHLLDISDLSAQELNGLLAIAQDIAENPEIYAHACEGKKLATLFFEPSTRTRLSFESAMLGLGGHVLTVTDAANSSTYKGESVADTARVVGCYSDLIAMRHPKAGSALVAARSAGVPVINAGDGGHWHPTQTLADLLTIYREKGTFDGLTIGLCGDLKYGRTVHSLIKAFSERENIRFVLISPEELRLPGYLKGEAGNAELIETASMEEVLPQLDILYMTRIQQERFPNPEDYVRLKDSYLLTPEKMKAASEDCIVMHPLPRVGEISPAVDRDPRAKYFDQVMNGKYMRMALILFLLQAAKEGMNPMLPEGIEADCVCRNPACITATERELEPRFRRDTLHPEQLRCLYCESRV